MSKLFLTVLNMSLTASYVILFVIAIRFLLKKAPKFISYALWGVVAFRLIIPFSFESIFSLMPRNTNPAPIPHDIIYQQSPKINSGIEAVDSFVNNSLPAPAVEASVNPLQIYVKIGTFIWLFGIIALLLYSFFSVLLLKRQLKGAKLIDKNIYEANNLKTPFVLGLINPKIYMPVGLLKEEQNYILIHERTHIRRKDHIIKRLAFLILTVHWFNPLVWVAFMLMSTDMELSCDERVLKVMNEDIKKPYANLLLSLAAGRHILNGSPLAFGEGNVKRRIKNVLNYKKPVFWVIAVSIIIVSIVGIGLMANPKADKSDESSQITDLGQQDNNLVSPQMTIEPTATDLTQDQGNDIGMPEPDYASDDIEVEKIKLDGYLADVTGIQDSYIDEIYVYGNVDIGFGNEKDLPLLETENNKIISDVLNLINDKSLWQEKFQDIGFVRGHSINSVHVYFRMKSEKGTALISLQINTFSRDISAECIWHPKSGKQFTFLYSDNKNLYAAIMRKLFNINIDKGWKVAGNINKNDFTCYSVKDKYSKDETLTINAVLINNGDEDITFNENIKGWIKITGEEDYKLWKDIEIPVPEKGVLMSRERMFFNLIQADLEHADLKPGTYTVEGEIGGYSIDKFKFIISEE